jgi:ribosomal-protein-alanine N-acetyltransferase
LTPLSFPIETERLLIRPLRPADADDLDDAYDGERTPAEIRARVEAHIDLHERVGYSAWAVCERVTERTVGYCGLKPLDDGSEVELVYRMSRPVRGRGLATEAGKACLIAGFDDLGLERIVAVTDPDNVAARRVLKKLGMTLMGVGPGRGPSGAQGVLYAITREEEAAAEAREG